MLIAEDLLLLLTDDTSGKLSAHPAKVDIVLAGANLVELALMGCVDSSRKAELIVVDRSPIGDAVLDATLETVTRETVIRGHGPPIQAVIGQSAKKVRKTLYERLVSIGMVRHEQRRILRDRWPAQDSRHKAEVRGRVIQALMAQTRPDTRNAALIALLHTIRHEPKIVDPRNYGMSKSQLIERGAVIVYSSWAPEAVRIGIDAIVAVTRRLARRAGMAALAVSALASALAMAAVAMAAVSMAAVAMAAVAMAAVAIEPPPQLEEFGSNATHAVGTALTQRNR